MRGVREPLLLIALASGAAFLPFATVGLPVSVALALSILLLLRTRLAQHAKLPLQFALASASFACLSYAGILAVEALRGSTFLAYRAAELSVPVMLLALATGLSRMADTAALGESGLWLSGIRVLVLGGLIFDLAEPGTGSLVYLLACPWFAFLVLQMRARIPLANAR